jgi:glutamate dehydrogenase
MLALIEATVRTNYYRHGGADPDLRSGGVALRLHQDPLRRRRRAADAPSCSTSCTSSRPAWRGSTSAAPPVSRGGIRWSDRPDDFRTEVLGLVQTQIVKNAVIVPGGSKGGFVTKRAFATATT